MYICMYCLYCLSYNYIYMSLHNIYIYIIYIYGIILYTWIINVHVFFKMFRNHCGFQWSQHRRCWSKTGRFSGLFGTCTDVFLDDCWMKQDMRGSEGFWGIFFWDLFWDSDWDLFWASTVDGCRRRNIYGGSKARRPSMASRSLGTICRHDLVDLRTVQVYSTLWYFNVAIENGDL